MTIRIGPSFLFTNDRPTPRSRHSTSTRGTGRLDAAGYVLGRPQWRVLVDAIRAYVGTGTALTDDERRRVRTALRVGTRSGT